MKNIINYFYHIFPDKIYEKNEIYFFFLNDFKYYFLTYKRSINDLHSLVEITNNLYNKGVKTHTFIKSLDNSFFIEFEKEKYVLLRVNCDESIEINLKDIIKFNNLILSEDLNYLYKNTWYERWSKQVDIFEKQISEYNDEYSEITKYFDYYVGLAENAISYINSIKENDNSKMCLCHQKIYFPITYGMLYNPLNYLFDNKSRDISEYIKTQFFNMKLDFDEIYDFFDNNRMEIENIKFMYARLLYPTYFFDTFEKVIRGLINESEMKKIFDLSEKYEKFLCVIYNFLKSKYNIEEIEWISKIDNL